jgi:hypothetical protein
MGRPRGDAAAGSNTTHGTVHNGRRK